MRERYTNDWNALVTSRSVLLILCPSDVGHASERFCSAAGTLSDIVDQRARMRRWPKGYDEAYEAMRSSRKDFIVAARQLLNVGMATTSNAS